MKTYRKNTAAIILNAENEILLFQRVDLPQIWGFPQGGIETSETPEQAVVRELEEEIGTQDFEIIGKYPELLRYDFPEGMTFPDWSYDGQEQQYFLIRLYPEASINVKTGHPEFISYKAVPFADIDFNTFSFKADVYRKALTYFKKEFKEIK
ncbi:RNA pyrophosphohydrolase [Lactococcus petauri]|uniref:RNA pyrophosphohydrolase n=1 Tax=Lactococcus petauri TaxID=1940789 RepID=UPI0018A9A45A|nr:RNA pyrophosphohydrolase [Lactococcus petauri]MDC0826699.1 RNA pyrophosphohydrolase [Lactococcus petauri]